MFEIYSLYRIYEEILMYLKLKFLTVPLLLIIESNILSANENILDQYPSSDLYSSPYEIIPDVFSEIGRASCRERV